ncbi:MAG: hypothetical protein K2Q14_02615 [Gammaproteobacteria bacterium]|nr:hypothetical protein [Gammaproteobacteria bacterium]
MMNIKVLGIDLARNVFQIYYSEKCHVMIQFANEMLKMRLHLSLVMSHNDINIAVTPIEEAQP